MLHFLVALVCARVAYATTATATFTAAGSNMTGTVTLNAGSLAFDLDLSNVDAEAAGLPSNCLDGGLKYHLHEKWTPSDNVDRIGGCGPAETGGHFDPYAACAGPSGNPACAECLSGTVYDCNTTTSIYTCEVGDWSGKYGKLTWDPTTKRAVTTYDSFYEVTSQDVVNMSIVFHCGPGGERAICAPFIVDGPAEANDQPQSWAGNAYAAIDSSSSITFSSTGMVTLKTQDWSAGVDAACTEMSIWVYEQWTDMANTALPGVNCTEAVIGKVWDGTNLCPPNSNNDNCNATNGWLCGNNAYEYSCDASVIGGGRYGCSPADVLGSGGQAPFATNTATTLSFEQFNMYPVKSLQGKAVAVVCTNDNSIAACAKLMPDTPGPSTSPTTKAPAATPGTPAPVAPVVTPAPAGAAPLALGVAAVVSLIATIM